MNCIGSVLNYLLDLVVYCFGVGEIFVIEYLVIEWVYFLVDIFILGDFNCVKVFVIEKFKR